MTTSGTGDEQIGIALEGLEEALLGRPTLNRVEVAERAGVPIELAAELWHLLGFAHLADDEVAFTELDVEALGRARDLLSSGVIGPDSQAALVRTWARSFARLAEWQTNLITGLAAEADDTGDQLVHLVDDILPKVERLQAYIWRRHLISTASRMVSVGAPGSPGVTMAVCFVDIVGYTSRSKSMDDSELVEWVEQFEQEATALVVDHGGLVIKTIGDEILFVADDPVAAAEVALDLTARGEDSDDPFPRVRAGLAHGEVVNRLGDVYGETVNIASRLTSAARPGAVLVDRGAHDVFEPDAAGRGETAEHEAEHERGHEGREGPASSPEVPPYRFRRVRRLSVKGYARLEAWAMRRAGS